METLQRTANRGSVSTGFDVDNSSVYEADNSSYIRFTNISTYASSARKKKFSMSMWFKLAEVGRQQMLWSTAANGYLVVQATGVIKWQQTYSGVQKTLNTNRVFRDPSAWYHVLIVVDTAQSTEADRTKLYVNGEQITDFSSATYPSQGDEAQNVYEQHNYIGTWGGGDHTNTGLSGYVSEFYFLSEIAPSPTDFGEFDDDTGIWIPKLYTAETIASPSSYLNFSNSSNLAEATSGQDWASGNVNSVSQATDTPTNNFCTPLLIQPFNSTDTITHTEGGTKLTTGGGTGWRTNMASVSLSSGKWYFEAKHPGTIDGDAIMTSIVPTARFGNSGYASFYGGQSSGDGIGWYWDSRRFRYDDGSTISPPQNTVNSGDILGIALDMDNNFVYSRINGGAWHNNGSADGDPTSGSSGTGGFAVADEPHMICTSMYQPSRNFFVNFGGYNAFPISSGASDANGYGTFEYSPPSGYYALCTKNLAEYG
jgi:hypothetical protein